MVAQVASFGRKALSSLKRRNFRLYFIGQGISQTGGWMQVIAQSWLVLHLTGSAMALGLLSALQFAPTLLLGPYAGVLADRFPKRRLLYITQTAAAVLAVALGTAVATDTVQVWMVFAMAGCHGMVNALDYPTRQAFLYELAGPRELVSAVGLTGTAANLARVAGPAIAGVLIASAGLAVCFFLNAMSFVAVLVCLALMRSSEFHRAEATHAETEKGVRRGFAYAARVPVVRAALVITAIVGVFTYEFSVTLPSFVKFSLDASALGLAYLMAAMGVGAAVGGLITAGRRGDGLGRLSVASLLFGVSTALVGLAPNLVTATVLMFFVGIFAARFTGLSNGILQMLSAASMRNRVMALWSTAFVGSAFLGGPLLGWLAQAAGPRWSLGAGAIGGLVAAAIGWHAVRRGSAVQPAELTRASAAKESAA
ncbi:MAG: MFS transporter [Coriobacteriia bacterium]|nr:MFS transporter [Coriobacteriia bacterium]